MELGGVEGGAIVLVMYGRIEESISNKKRKKFYFTKKKREKEGKNEGRTKKKPTEVTAMLLILASVF